MARWLFVAAYTASGAAGLIYEVTWTRLLTLYIGHTTAAASAVVASFMGGMALGAALGGRAAARLTRRQALAAYAVLEGVVIGAALVLPLALEALSPVLARAYRDGVPGVLFPLTRLLACGTVLAVPAMALGATFPLAVRWFVTDAGRSGTEGGRLYAANTAGAALGAASAGFLLIPAIGGRGTIYVGVAASAASIAAVVMLMRSSETAPGVVGRPERRRPSPKQSTREERGDPYWLALMVVAITGFATFTVEIAWTRLSSMIVGPSTYAFAATLVSFIAGLALGAAAGAALAGRVARKGLAISLVLSGASAASMAASIYVGGPLPRAVAETLAAGQSYGDLLVSQSALVAAAMAPAAVLLGMAFPLALDIAGGADRPAAESVGRVYAVSTIAAMAGSLMSGFVLISRAGLEHTIGLATVLLAGGAAVAAVGGRQSVRARAGGLAIAIAVTTWWLASPRWDRELLASGAYKYARRVPTGVDPAAALKAGVLVDYREGPTGTVTVKRLTGAHTLAIDGKIDASTGGDMLTQKTLAHLPLLLHDNPREVFIIGLGSGVTVGSALVHPVSSVEVVEISPEVVAAASHFANENRHALNDPRTRLVVADGRSHLTLTSRRYDVIISEPSNPWMAGVAALFTREFFTAARDRLAPGGIICQWTHTYDISGDDLRSIVATFAGVFPSGTMWLVGSGDLLLVGGVDPIEPRLAAVERAWGRPGVADDVQAVAMRTPFSLLSLYAGGPAEMRAYADGAALQSDDRLALEFTGPRALNTAAADENAAALRQLLTPGGRPDAVARAYASATASQWRDRAEMMFKGDAYGVAYANYATALRLAPGDAAAADGLVRSATAAGRHSDALLSLRAAMAADPGAAAPRIASSKLLASLGKTDEAIAAARDAAAANPDDPAPLEQLASIYADAGDAPGLRRVIERLRRWQGTRPGPDYYLAAAAFIEGRLDGALVAARAAAALDPQDARARNLLGAAYASAGQRDAARQAFAAALARDPRELATYINLGLLDLSSGNRAAAADWFAEALTLDPSSRAARDGLSQSVPRP
jgi:spermidine synthase